MTEIESDLLHLGKLITGVETFGDNNDLCSNTKYVIGVMKANNITLDSYNGTEGFIADAGKKIWEVIKIAIAKIKDKIKSIINFLTPDRRYKVNISTKENTKKSIEKLIKTNHFIYKKFTDALEKYNHPIDNNVEHVFGYMKSWDNSFKGFDLTGYQVSGHQKVVDGITKFLETIESSTDKIIGWGDAQRSKAYLALINYATDFLKTCINVEDFYKHYHDLKE